MFWIETVRDDNGDSVHQDLEKQQDIFKEYEKLSVGDVPDFKMPNIKHSIELIPGSFPVAKHPYRMSPSVKKEVAVQLDGLLQSGKVVQQTSPFAAPVLFVKKTDGSRRLCSDYRGLNNITMKSKFPLPRIDGVFNQLKGVTIFCKLDLASGYHQVAVKEADQYKSSFKTNEGQYVWKVLPFGLTGAPSSFQMLMNDTLKGLLGKCTLCYLDDIIIYSKYIEEHKMHLHLVLNRLRQAKLFAKKNKCALFMSKINFLGHTFDKDGLHVDDSKIDAIKQWPVPKTPKQCLSMISFCNFYREFIKNF